MTASIRLFTHSNIVTATVQASFYTTDALLLLRQPYLGRQTLVVDTGTAKSSDESMANGHCNILFMQVETGKAVHLEINPPGRNVTADTSSPVFSGDQVFQFGPNWTVSILEASI